MADDSTWSGQWVAQRLGIALDGDERLRDLLGLALRRNPKRAHLLVSTVLGKHVPQRPRKVYGAGLALGEQVRALLGDHEASRAVVLGYAETATALGHSVADGIALAPYLHSTRRAVPGVPEAAGFEEEHSHATSHLLLPEDPLMLAGDGPLVLVDDEFSTGRTVLNTISALHRAHPRSRYVIVALVDMRAPEDRRALDAFAADLGARVDVVTLAAGTVRLPGDVLLRGQALVTAHTVPDAPPAAQGRLSRAVLDWPAGIPDGGRHGFTPEHRDCLESALPGLGKQLAEAVADERPPGGQHGDVHPHTRGTDLGSGTGPPSRPSRPARRILVLGCEELMYAPLRLAEALENAVGEHDEVRFSTTTRSPVLAVDDPGYAIRTRVTFPAHDAPADGPGQRYAYNVAAGADPARRFDAVLVVVDSTGDTPALHARGGLLDTLRSTTDRVVLAVVPSYVPTDRQA